MSDERNSSIQYSTYVAGLTSCALSEGLSSLTLPVAVLKVSGQVCYANTAFMRQLSIGINDVDSTLSFEASLRGNFQGLPADFRYLLRQPPPFSLRLADSGGHTVWHLSFGALMQDQRLVCFHCLNGPRDSTAVQECDSELDALTGLGNRKRLARLMDELEPPTDAPPRAVMMVDLDGFRRVNDTLGHDVGDRLLSLVASRLRRAVRPSDPLIRVHADEFIVLLEGEIDQMRLTGLGERIVELISRTFLVSGQQLDISASVGIAVADTQSLLWGDLVRQAELAVVAAKQTGCGATMLFTSELEQRALRYHEMALALRKALARQELHVVYQPQLSLENGNITCFEALLRWTHPALGEIEPDSFIPLAESLGEIHKIGRWVLKQACREAKMWPEEITVAVNVSPSQIVTRDFAQSVANILSSEQFPAGRLEIEITEKMLLEPAAASQIALLTELGVGIVLDDFGSGYSALSYLNQYHFSKIKLDQSFFRLPAQRASESLIRILISLGQALAVPVVAEGVESVGVCEALKRQGCSMVQGFLVSKPVLPSLIPQLFREFSPGYTGVTCLEE
jgi:diguanylate cyclase (GGDEF)-like protein